LIFGKRGIGKTWLCTLIGLALTRKRQADIEIGSWYPKHAASCLYIDAEMNNRQLQDNISRLAECLPPEDPEAPLLILSAHDFTLQYQTQFNIGNRETREALYNLLVEDRRIEVLILDNTAALTPGIEENTKEAWDPINQWLISLRHLGVAVVLIHHAGKAGQQRGTSGREDAMDTIIRLDYPEDYDSAKDFAYFQVTFEKSRNLQPGDDKSPFCLRIVEHVEGGLTWKQESGLTRTQKIDQDIAEVLHLWEQGLSNTQIAEKIGRSNATVTKRIKRAQRLSYLESSGKHMRLTAKGKGLLNNFTGAS
jgi:DNA-binding CsgD family transcriptional regulator